MKDNSDSLISSFNHLMRSRYFMTTMMANYRQSKLHDDLHSVRGKSRILFLLKKQDGLKNSKIVEILDIKPSSVSLQVQALEEEGLVERRDSENDKRVSLIFLTEKGKKQIEEGNEKTDDATSKVFEVLSDDEKVTLETILEKMNDRLKELDGDDNNFFSEFAGQRGAAMKHEMHHHMNHLRNEYRNWWK